MCNVFFCSVLWFLHIEDVFQNCAHQAPVPGKPISANRRLNPLNPGMKFIRRLVSVPESTISAIQGIN